MPGNGTAYRAALLLAAVRGQAPCRLDDPLIRFCLRIVGLRDIVGLRVALVHMIDFEDMARAHMAPVHSLRVALTHMVVARMVATVPVRR